MVDLFQLNLALTNPGLSHIEKLQKIVHTAAEHVPQADVVSLWVANENTSSIVCIAKFDKYTGAYSDGGVIGQDTAQAYFSALFSHDFLAIEDVRHHPFTKHMVAGYFEPCGFYSLLDYVLHDNFEPRGVLCCESRTQVPQWQDQEKAALKRIANMSSLFFDLPTYQRAVG